MGQRGHPPGDGALARAALGGALPLPQACEALVERVDAELRRFLGIQRRGFDDADPGVADLFEELDRVIAAGGKRLRPLFCLLGHRAAGAGIGEEAVRAAAALELLHTFAIVHDDVMDGSPERRGAPASWVHLAEAHRRAAMRGDPARYGLAGAILLGDLALVLAGRALRESGFPEERLLPALERYDRMRAEVVAGQYLDVLAAHRARASEEEARRIATLKSGGYTVEGPLHIGAILGGAGGTVIAELSAYGLPLGEAFQLRDDVLGVFGDPAVTGKDRHSDLREGKRTVLVARAAAAAAPPDRRFLEERLGAADLTAEEMEWARGLLESTGALEHTLALIDDLAGRAKAALAAGNLPPEATRLLGEMADLVAVRRM
jgi:geranylgeranyl diphosphate synthase type I